MSNVLFLLIFRDCSETSIRKQRILVKIVVHSKISHSENTATVIHDPHHNDLAFILNDNVLHGLDVLSVQIVVFTQEHPVDVMLQICEEFAAEHSSFADQLCLVLGALCKHRFGIEPFYKTKIVLVNDSDVTGGYINVNISHAY